MDYIYDIVLNFHEVYYDFYEWKNTDKIVNIKKIPIYRIFTKDYLNIKNNYTTIDKTTLPKNNKIFLLTNNVEVMGLIIDDNGRVLKKSSLIFEEADDILEDKELINLIDIKYVINKVNKVFNCSRLSYEKDTYIKKYFKKINKEKDEYILKYIYYDIYNEDEKDIDKILNDLLVLSKTNKNKLYETLKRVNLELNK